MFKKILKWTGITLLTLIIILVITIASRQHLTYTSPFPEVAASADSAIIARGKYLVYGPAHCVECHVAKEDSIRLTRGEEVRLSGGTPFNIPIGSIYPPNITSDKETGIGNLSDKQIARSLRYGIRSDGTALFDLMPFHNTSDEDLTAIISYLRTLKPVQNKVPVNDMNMLGNFVRAFFIKPVYPDGEVLKSIRRDTSAAYGEYLAASVANCKGCHTNRDLTTGAFIGEPYAGGLKLESAIEPEKYNVITPNLTPDATGRITGWSQEMFLKRFRQGTIIKHTHMPWEAFGRMTDDELKAIYNFLQTVKPVKNAIPQTVVPIE